MWDVETPMNQKRKQDFPIHCRSRPSLVYYLLIFCQFFHFPTVARIKELSLRREPVERFVTVRSLGSIVLILTAIRMGLIYPVCRAICLTI